jgi:hypothetical protein
MTTNSVKKLFVSSRVVAGLLLRQQRRVYSHKECGDYQHIYNKTGQFFYHEYGSR